MLTKMQFKGQAYRARYIFLTYVNWLVFISDMNLGLVFFMLRFKAVKTLF